MTDTHIVGGNRRVVQHAKVKKGGWTKARRQRFLDELARTCNVRMATEASGMRGKSPYDLRKRDPAFAALWQEALAIGYERLEEAVLHHALTGLNAIEIDPDRDMTEDDAAAGDDAVEGLGRGHAVPGSGVAPTPPTMVQMQIALALLNRQRGTVDGTQRRRRLARQATDEEVDAALKKKLDALARQLRRSKGEAEE